MKTIVRKLKALLSFKGMSDTNLIQQLINVDKGLTGNPNLPNTPVDLATFKSGIDALTVLVTDAADGSKKAITAKNKQREVMIKQVTLLGHYVEMVSNDDPAIFTTSDSLLLRRRVFLRNRCRQRPSTGSTVVQSVVPWWSR